MFVVVRMKVGGGLKFSIGAGRDVFKNIPPDVNRFLFFTATRYAVLF